MRGRQDLRLDRLAELGGHLLLRCFRQLLFLFVAVKDRCTILVAFVAELAARIERVYIRPEHFEELFVGHLRRIIFDFDGLEMAGRSGGELLIGRVRFLPARIARCRGDHAVDLVEGRLHAPEAAAGKNGRRRLLRLSSGAARDESQEYRDGGDEAHASSPEFKALLLAAGSRLLQGYAASADLKVSATPFMQ